MSYARGATPEEDKRLGFYREGILTSVRPYEGREGWSVDWQEDDGVTMGCGVRDVGVEPKVGDTFGIYGSFGRPFHGQALNGKLLWYQTIEEQEVERRRVIRKHEQDKRESFEANKDDLDAKYEALPAVFQKRLDKFRATNPDFRWEFESYEMSCCVDAVKIANYCRENRIEGTPEGVDPSLGEKVTAFAKLPWEEQRKADLFDGHSGNSFSFAVRLAFHWVTKPEMVEWEHGALTPLVGCVEYGCPHPWPPREDDDETG